MGRLQTSVSVKTPPARAATGDRPAFDSRLVCYACILLLASDAWTLGQLWARGDVPFGRDTIVGHDLAVFWAAGRLAWIGKAAAAYDWTAVRDLLAASLGPTSVQYVTIFGYPPWFLLALALLGALPYPAAAALWLIAMFSVYTAAIRAVLPGGTALIAALAAPAVFSNIVLGQDGLLTAGLLAGAAVLLDAAPISAGVMVGLLTYKPQFGLLLPLFLALTGRWRVFAGAAGTVGGLAAIAAGVFGPGVLSAFAGSIPTAGSAYLRHSALFVGEWGQLASVYGLLRTVGCGGAVAWCGHFAAAATAAAGLLWMAGRKPRRELEAAALATAAVVASPYCHIYDLAILTVPIVFLLRDGIAHGIAPAEQGVLAAAFLTPLAVPLAIGTGPDPVACFIGPLMCLLLGSLIAWRLPIGPRIDVGPASEPAAAPRRGTDSTAASAEEFFLKHSCSAAIAFTDSYKVTWIAVRATEAPMKTIPLRLWRDQRGVTSTEYAVLVVFVVLVLALGAGVLGTSLSSLFGEVGSMIGLAPPLPAVP